MTPRPNEPLSPLELVALAIADVGRSDSDVGDALPQRVWDELHNRGLLITAPDGLDEGFTDTTPAGAAALLENLEALVGRDAIEGAA